MPPSATTVSQAKSRPKQYKLWDERGLFLIVTQEGSRYWRFDYRLPAVKSGEFLYHQRHIFITAKNVEGGDRIVGGMSGRGGHAPIQTEA